MRYGGGVEEAGGSLNKMGFPRDGEESGRMLFFIAVADVLSDREEVGVTEAVLFGGIGPVRDGISFHRDVGGMRRLIGRLSHSLRGGVVFTVGVAAETGVLKGVLSFGGVNVDRGRSVEADGLSFDNFGVGR